MLPSSTRTEGPAKPTWYPDLGFVQSTEDGNVAASRQEVALMAELVEAKGYNGHVSFDGIFVTITRKGALGRMTIGKGEKKIPVASITAVQWKPPGLMVNGYISFGLAGANEKQAQTSVDS